MTKQKYIYKLVIVLLTFSTIACGNVDLTDLANNNLYATKAANKSKVPVKANNGFKDLNLKFNDGEQDLNIHGWYYTRSKYSPTIVYLHGNATNIGSLNEGGILNALKAMNANVVVIDYPGYGKSKGFPTMKSLTTSAGQALKWANKRYKGDIVLWGRSLGTGVAAQSVKNYGHLIDAYILTSPWTSVKNMIKHHFNSLADQVPEEWLADNSYDTTSALKYSKKPGLIFHGNEDEVIPYKLGKTLYDEMKYKSKVKFVTLDGFEHNDIFSSNEMWTKIKNFVD